MGFEIDCVEHESETKNRPVFQATYCSQCGCEFGPGRAGYSSCEEHRKATDMAMHKDKLADGYASRNFRSAMLLQIKNQIGRPL